MVHDDITRAQKIKFTSFAQNILRIDDEEDKFTNEPTKIQQNLRPRLQMECTSNTSRQIINLSANQKGYDNSETSVEKL